MSNIAKILLSLGCVKLSPKRPFTYASGLIGPVYCDNRLLMSSVKDRQAVISAFSELISQNNLKFDQIGALATAGIVHGAWLAERLGVPMIYVRPKSKEHGRKNRIEGKISRGQKILVVEDLVNQGSSAKSAIEHLREEGLEVVGLVCIVQYGFEQVKELFQKLNCPLFSLTDLHQILAQAKEQNILSENEIKMVEKWVKDPN